MKWETTLKMIKNVRRDVIWVKKLDLLPTCELRTHSLKINKTLKLGMRDVLKLKKVAMTNIMGLHLT